MRRKELKKRNKNECEDPHSIKFQNFVKQLKCDPYFLFKRPEVYNIYWVRKNTLPKTK